MQPKLKCVSVCVTHFAGLWLLNAAAFLGIPGIIEDRDVIDDEIANAASYWR